MDLEILILLMESPDSSVSVVTSWKPRNWSSIPARARAITLLHSKPTVRPTQPFFSSRIKWSKREADHSHSSTGEIDYVKLFHPRPLYAFVICCLGTEPVSAVCSVLHNSFPSVIPTLQPFKLLRQNLNIAWTPVPAFTKLRKNFMLHKSISTAYIINATHQ
jgi:hypothetical protein